MGNKTTLEILKDRVSDGKKYRLTANYNTLNGIDFTIFTTLRYKHMGENASIIKEEEYHNSFYVKGHKQTIDYMNKIFKEVGSELKLLYNFMPISKVFVDLNEEEEDVA